jgi:hypothetical protein
VAWIYDIYRYREKDGREVCEHLESKDNRPAAIKRTWWLNKDAEYYHRQERYKYFAYEE